MSVFKNYQTKKEGLRRLCQEAFSNGFINEEERIEIEEKLESEMLTIGVIGQMKAGKSTFLNAFVFEDDVLPAATTPMTAALTVITYGEQECLEAEFYTKEEWDEQCRTAKLNIDEVSDERRSKIQAAQELVEKSRQLAGRLEQLLGKKQTDTLDNLVQYVGADGRFVSITKAVKIYYPKEELKGVEIVDTPGFNDPIVSREERTKDFLKKADVVLMLLYAGRPFDATDREIVFKHVGQCGAGKLVIGINKYDMSISQGETEAEIKKYVVDEIEKACKSSSDTSLIAMLRETAPIPLSAEMALLSYLPIGKIQSTDRYKHAWDRYVDMFEIDSPSEFREKSLFAALSTRVQEVIMKEKGDILLAKPRNRIFAMINAVIEENKRDIGLTEQTIKNLSLPDDELEEKLKEMLRAERKFRKTTETSLLKLKDKLLDLSKRWRRRVEDKLDAACNEAEKMVGYTKRWVSEEGMWQGVHNILHGLLHRAIPREKEDLETARTEVLDAFSEAYFNEISEIKDWFMEDVDVSDLLKLLRGILEEEKSKDAFEDASTGKPLKRSTVQYVMDFMENFFVPIGKCVGGAIRLVTGNSGEKRDVKSELFRWRSNFDIKDELDQIMNIEYLTGRIENELFDKFLTPLISELKKILEQKEGRDQMLVEAITKLEQLKEQQEELDKKWMKIKLADSSVEN